MIKFNALHKILNLATLFEQVTSKPIVIYPNSGETYDAVQKKWVVSQKVSIHAYA